MSRLQYALNAASRGFYVFPVEENGKRPAISDWPNQASRDAGQIEKWFKNTSYNIGICTGRFGDDEALLVLDVDNKNGKKGDEAILALELGGLELPASFEQSTPSGGRHIVYRSKVPVRQGVDVLGSGLDIRSRGGFIVGTGSEIDGRPYAQINGHYELAYAPDWLVNKLSASTPKPQVPAVADADIDTDRAARRAVQYLESLEPVPEGSRNHEGFKAAAKLKDLGCTVGQTVELMEDHWKCVPPLEPDELREVVLSAFKYGREAPGIEAPESIFTPVESRDDKITEVVKHPMRALNDEYAFIKNGAFVLQETTDAKGRFTTIRLSPSDMHAWFANKQIQMGEKHVPLSRVWMQWNGRREYDSVVFAPERAIPDRFYNLWRGFSVAPSEKAKHPALDAFLEHALNNVCQGNRELCRWLIGFFAHMIQKPWEKPLVALVFKGLKGTGKNALVERVGALLGRHFLVASDQRYLVGNFNSHLENNLFFILDEASWAGDKRAEGKLKDLITGSEHLIERKGFDPYNVDNLSRIALISNEKWVVPASADERRFAVFNVGTGRQQDRKFFEDMRVGMERGGYEHLLRYLLDFDLTGLDVNAAPLTQGLLEQKHASLDPVQEWWLDCLHADALVGSDWDGALPAAIPSNRMRSAFDAWARSRNLRSRLPGKQEFSRVLREIAPRLTYQKIRPDDKTDTSYGFRNPGIAPLRDDWEKYIGGPCAWDDL